jgi:hypothetical protein
MVAAGMTVDRIVEDFRSDRRGGDLDPLVCGRSQHELSDSLGVDRKTVRKYVGPAVAAGLGPGGPPMGEADWRRLVCEWFPELADARLRQVS